MVDNQEQNKAGAAGSAGAKRAGASAVLFQAPAPFLDPFSAPPAKVSRSTKLNNPMVERTLERGEQSATTGNVRTESQADQPKVRSYAPLFAAAPMPQPQIDGDDDRGSGRRRKTAEAAGGSKRSTARSTGQSWSDSDFVADDDLGTDRDTNSDATRGRENQGNREGRKRNRSRSERSADSRSKRQSDRRGRGVNDSADDAAGSDAAATVDVAAENLDNSGWSEDENGTQVRRIRRRRTRTTEDSGAETSDLNNSDEEEADSTEVQGTHRVRRRRSRSTAGSDEPTDQITVVKGSTRLEAKKQRRREGRKEGRRQRPITESEYLARRESVNRQMLIRCEDGVNQIAVLEDRVLVEHYVSRQKQSTLVGSVFLGRVQNVLPSMEAAFVDLGKGRNAVLYAGEVNWDAAGLQGSPRRIESALKPGDTVTVQVTKDPIGHKGARLTSQITLPGRYLVLVPGGTMTGISRKLPEPERQRLKKLLRRIVPKDFGVIIRTAAEGSTEEQLEADVKRLTKQWDDLQKKSQNTKSAPVLLYDEPELSLRVVRDIFNEDFEKLIIQGKESYDKVSKYVKEFAPDLEDRVEQWVESTDIFEANRIDEQLAKGMDRKVWLPSGGYLIIDRTEAMTVIDVNTGKYTGSGGTLEETVTRNNLEAAEEIMRQLRLRDIGGIVVIDFVDMVLESNRDLVLRRLIECLGRDRTRHQVTEVTSLGLVQMTRKRVGEGLVEAFSTPCDCCDGRGFIVHSMPVERTKTGRAIVAREERKRSEENGDSDSQRKNKGQKVAIRKRDLKAQPNGRVEEEPNPHQEANQKSMAMVAAAAKASREEQQRNPEAGESVESVTVEAGRDSVAVASTAKKTTTGGTVSKVRKRVVNTADGASSDGILTLVDDSASKRRRKRTDEWEVDDLSAGTWAEQNKADEQEKTVQKEGAKRTRKAAQDAVKAAIADLADSMEQLRPEKSTGRKRTGSAVKRSDLEAELAQSLDGKVAAKRGSGKTVAKEKEATQEEPADSTSSETPAKVTAEGRSKVPDEAPASAKGQTEVSVASTPKAKTARPRRRAVAVSSGVVTPANPQNAVITVGGRKPGMGTSDNKNEE